MYYRDLEGNIGTLLNIIPNTMVIINTMGIVRFASSYNGVNRSSGSNYIVNDTGITKECGESSMLGSLGLDKVKELMKWDGPWELVERLL